MHVLFVHIHAQFLKIYVQFLEMHVLFLEMQVNCRTTPLPYISQIFMTRYKSKKLIIKVEEIPTEGLDDLTTNTKVYF